MAFHSCAALALLTAGFAGYPHGNFLVGTSNEVEPPFDAQVPTPPSNGGLTSEQVRQVVTLHAGAIRACYEIEAQRDAKLGTGTVTTAWQIDAHGAAHDAAIVSSELHSAPLEGCMLRQIGSWVFPASNNAPTTIAAYPFRFGVTPSPRSGG
jgi:hypothetical protein